MQGGSDVDNDPVVNEQGASLAAVRLQRIGVRTALDGLELALAAPSAGRANDWIRTVGERASALSAAFTNHVLVTERPAGLFDDITAHAPRLANQISRLRDEHVEIAAALAAIPEPANSEDPNHAVSAVREASLAVMGAIVRHRNAGSSLLYEAYFVDIDASD
jgi:hypothetical protein